MKQPDLYYFKTIKVTSQAWSKFTENTRLWLVFSIQNLTRLVASFLWFENSIDQVVSWNKCQLKSGSDQPGRLKTSEARIYRAADKQIATFNGPSYKCKTQHTRHLVPKRNSKRFGLLKTLICCPSLSSSTVCLLDFGRVLFQ